MKWLLQGVEHELTEAEANANWNGRHSSHFKCAICDRRFQEGDVVLSLYTNNEQDKAISGNPIVCAYHGMEAECKNTLKRLADQIQAMPVFIRRRYGMGER